MVAVDTNLLVYAHRSDAPFHQTARSVLESLARGAAAICLQHGAAELWSADRDFSRFHELRTRNPLIS